MDLPNPPRDTGLRNIIDKLAEFVARNGPEFESITKAKQKGNPKFEFLYGGELYNYYQYRVASEQAFLKQQASISQAQHNQSSMSVAGAQQQQQQQQQQQLAAISNSSQMGFLPSTSNMSMNQQQQSLWHNGPNGPNGNGSSSNNVASQIEAINIQQNTLRDQIRQSEQNLSAQHGVLIQQQQKQVDEAIHKAQNDSIHKQAEDHNVYLAEFDAILQPIIESCTKDSISAGKNWILQHTSDTAKCNVVLQYLLKKALVNGASFTQKLHLIYLVNDVLHHCVRKNANDLKSCLENVVIPMFCSAEIIASDEQKCKLCKLLSLWESKAKFFDACVISKLRSPESSMQEYKTNLMNIHNNVITKYTQATKAALDSYQQQHQIFIQHASQQIAVLESQKQTLEQQVLAQVMPSTSMIPPLLDPQQLNSANMNAGNMIGGGSINVISSNPSNQMSNMQMAKSINPPPPPPLMAQKIAMPTEIMPSPSFGSPGSMSNQQQSSSNIQNPFSGNNISNGSNNSNTTQYPVSQLPASHPYAQLLLNSASNSSGDYTSPPPAPSFQIPDLSKPPPGFTQGQGPSEDDVKPSVPYYELPAGLMVPLIRLEDYEYKPLDPQDVRLPPPAPQSERLSSAIVAFYSLPSHDRPRDVEGWEKLGLYEYYKVKNAARKQKEEEIQSGQREKSRSPSPIYVEPTKPKKPNKRCYRSKSRSRSRSKSNTPPPLSRRSRSRSPPPPPPPIERNRNSNRYSNNRRSPKRSPIRDRDRDRDRGGDRSERDRGDRQRERAERERDRSSVSPPSFFGGNYPKSNEFIEETNKGHQMLMKMGWAGSGTGLGSKGQGIDSPISGGEVRDRKDMYKGVGINLNDPYENFRKNKGAAFIHRMRSRAEEKS